MRLYRRVQSARVEPAKSFFTAASKGRKGISPELCPAIRDFYSLGAYVFSPICLEIYDSHSFEVQVNENPEGERLLIPGIIGAPGSREYYARIDSGFSLVDLSSPVLGVITQLPSYDLSNIRMPPVVYPAGYSGPILMPVSCSTRFSVTRSAPLLHLIPLDLDTRLEVIEEEVRHQGFEGLVYESEIRSFQRTWSVLSTDLVPR